MADVLNIAGGQQPDQVRQVDGPGRPALVHVLRPVVLPQAGTPLPHKTGSCSALLNWYQKNRPVCPKVKMAMSPGWGSFTTHSGRFFWYQFSRAEQLPVLWGSGVPA